MLPISRFAHDIYATPTHFITQNHGGYLRVVTFSQFSAVVEFKTNVNETLFEEPYM